MNKKLIILLIFLSVFLMRTTASAATITSGDFSLEYNDPLFDVKNAAPGGEYSSGFSVHNTGSQAHDLQFKLNIVTDPEKLADFLFLKINETAGGVKNCLWGCSGNKKISQLNNSEIIFQNIFGGQKRDYEFILLFSPLAGNDLQNTKMTFDMTIGYFGQSPPTNPKNNNHHHNHHHHNNKPGLPDGPIVGLNGRVLETGPGQGEVEQGTKEVAGEETGGGETQGVEVSNCQSWPLWVWILALVIFSALLGRYLVKNYKANKIVWKFGLIWTFAAVVFWYYFDKCREYEWFLYGTIIVAITSYFFFLWLLKRKIKSSISAV